MLLLTLVGKANKGLPNCDAWKIQNDFSYDNKHESCPFIGSWHENKVTFGYRMLQIVLLVVDKFVVLMHLLIEI